MLEFCPDVSLRGWQKKKKRYKRHAGNLDAMICHVLAEHGSLSGEAQRRTGHGDAEH
ncbi:MAG: hypothetical protein ACI856_002859 [Kiritimatiellia bacterium]|jgi:hypothetical protein